MSEPATVGNGDAGQTLASVIGLDFAVEQLQTCQHGVPCFSREYGQDVEPCGEAATARVRWYDTEEKKWDDWLYLCEKHHAQVADEMNVAKPNNQAERLAANKKNV